MDFYPNIPHDEGLIGIKTFRILYRMRIKKQYFSVKLLFFKQLSRTAIETKMAPPYPIISMGDL